MALTAEARAQLIDVIVRVPAPTLGEVVVLHRTVPNYQNLRMRFSSDIPEESRREVIASVVDAYDAAGRIPLLCGTLATRVYVDESLQAKLLANAGNAAADAAKQRALSKRASTMPLLELMQFMNAIGGKICVVVAVDGASGVAARGTGFLISASHVLTSYHTLQAHIVPGTGKARPSVAGDRLYVVFDHLKGDPITG